MEKIFAKIGIAFGSSLTVCEAVNLEPLWTALITLAVSIITVLTVEGVAWLKAYFKSQKAKREAEEKEYEKKCQEADEIVSISDAEENKKED